jgi:hypothetical protein
MLQVSINKTDPHDITDILFKVASNNITWYLQTFLLWKGKWNEQRLIYYYHWKGIEIWFATKYLTIFGGNNEPTYLQ